MKQYTTMQIYYDSKCPLCTREMGFIKRRDSENKIHLIDIHDPDLDLKKVGKSKPELMAKIHASIDNENFIEGVEVFRQAYSRVGFAWLAWITTVPILKQFADLLYTVFARYRIRIGKLFGSCDDQSCQIK